MSIPANFWQKFGQMYQRDNSFGGILKKALPFATTAIPGIGPIAGSLLSTGLQYGLNKVDSAITNKYNSPRQQLSRLRKAGLPGAAIFHGPQNTAELPRATNVDPFLGTAKKVEQYQQNRITNKDLDLATQKLRLDTAEADIKQGERNYQLAQSNEILHGIGGKGTTNQMQRLEAEKLKTSAEAYFKDAEADIKEIELGVQDYLNEGGKLIQAYITKIAKDLAQIGSIEALTSIRSLEAFLNQSMKDDFTNAGKNSGLLGLLYKLFIIVASKL